MLSYLDGLILVARPLRQIIVHINDSFGHVLSELIMTGKMDMAIIYGSEPIKGVTLRPLFREELFLVSPPGTVFDKPPTEALPLSALADVQLLLPSKIVIKHLL